VLGVALAGAGCGGDEVANEPRPAAPVTLSVVIAPQRVSASPSRLGAGLVELLVSNQSAASQRLGLRSERLAPGGTRLAQSTGPIPPQGAATLQVELDQGTYVLSGATSRIEPARIVVGPPRPSARDRLLQP